MGNNIVDESLHKIQNRSGEEGGFFEEILMYGCAEDRVAVLRAYLDESERPSGIFCVAGFVFRKRSARMFMKRWSGLFGDTCFHMVDLVAGQEQFKNVSRKRRDELLRKAVHIIEKYMDGAVAMSCNVNEVFALSPRFIRGFGHAYPICCHLAMFAIGNWLRSSGSSELVTYIFESGHKNEAEANDFIRNVVLTQELREAYRYHGHAFLPKSDAIPLQAADLLAWEWAKFRDETLEHRIRPVRRSLRALMENNLNKFCGVHTTGKPLARALGKIRELGLEQIREEDQERAARQKRRKQ